MENSRTKNTALTASAGIIRIIIHIFATFFSRTVFIYMLGEEYLSLNGLFSDILSLLSLAELGVGTAIVFYLYKPIAEHDTQRIKSLMRFYRTCYTCVGLFIIGIGLCLLPVLPRLVNFDTELPVNLYPIYILSLLNSGCTYLWSAYKQSFLQANQMGYKLEKLNSFFSILGCAADILVLIIARNYIAYLVVRLIIVLLKNYMIGRKVDRLFPSLKGKADPISRQEIKLIFKDLYSILLQNISYRLMHATDNIIISLTLGTIFVGYCSNYFIIILQVNMFYSILLNSFRASVGNLIVEDRTRQYRVYKELSMLNQILSAVMIVGLFQVFNSFMNIWLGNLSQNYILKQSVVCMIVLSLYSDFSLFVLNIFREGCGHFEIGRYSNLIASIANIVLSFVFAKPWGLFGVFMATMVSKFIFKTIPFVYSIGKTVFDQNGLKFLAMYFGNLAVVCAMMAISWVICRPLHMGNFLQFILEIILCGSVTLLLCVAVYVRTSAFRDLMCRVKNMTARLIQKKQ